MFELEKYLVARNETIVSVEEGKGCKEDASNMQGWADTLRLDNDESEWCGLRSAYRNDYNDDNAERYINKEFCLDAAVNTVEELLEDNDMKLKHCFKKRHWSMSTDGSDCDSDSSGASFNSSRWPLSNNDKF